MFKRRLDKGIEEKVAIDESSSEDLDEYDDDQDDEEAEDEINHDQQEIEDNHLHLPLYQRLQQLQEGNPLQSSSTSSQRLPRNPTRISRQPRSQIQSSSDNHNDITRKDKHAPTQARSNRPVPILRENSNLIHQPKFVDPRFSDATGKLNYDKFIQNYSFLDDTQEQEIAALEKKMKKVKNIEMKEAIKQELDKSKQQMLERRRKVKVRQAIREIYAEENEKV